MSGLRRPLLTARVIRGLKKILPDLQPDDPDVDRSAATRYLAALVRYTQTEDYMRSRDKKNETVRTAKAKRKDKPLP